MDRYQNTLKVSNIYKKKPSQIIDIISKGEIDSRHLPSDSYRAIQNRKSNSGFIKFLKILLSLKCNFTEDKRHVNALYTIYLNKDKWIGDIAEWKRNSYNVDKQIKSIGRHLICKYDIPKFMDNIWYGGSGSSNWIDWYTHIGQGGNIRNAELPNDLKLTKKMAHHFLLAPDNYTPNEALRWGQIHGLGGDERMTKALVGSKIGESFSRDEFWVTIIHFFVRNPMIDTSQVAPLIDYISHIKYETNRELVNGVYDNVGPQSPNFEIKGRTVESLINGMERWHNILNGKGKRKVNLTWGGVDIEDYKFVTGKEKNQRTFYFQQLLSSVELRKEGSAHGHCVSSYSPSCYNGRVSIWSFSVSDYLGVHKPLLTIELKRENVISQIRGKGNRLPTKHELSLIGQWASKNNLSFSNWL